MGLHEFIAEQIAYDEARTKDPHDWYHNSTELTRKCDVAQRVLALHKQVRIPYEEVNDLPGVCSSETSNEYFTDGRGWSTPYPCETVKALGLLYEDRPGYLDQWRPR